MENEERLARFGQAFVENVRARTIEHFEQILDGSMKSSDAEDLRKTLVNFDSEDFLFIKIFLASVVDESLFKMLFMFEEGEWTIIEKITAANSGTEGLAEISDGLAGELFGERGWVAKYR